MGIRPINIGMKNLVVFGCSMTYGHGLADCFIPPVDPGPEPSKFAWPGWLSRKLQLNCVNLSKPGDSNLEILYKLLNYNFSSDDSLVVIMWTYSNRDLVFKDGVDDYRLGVWIDSKEAKDWLKVHSNFDLEMRSWIYKHHGWHFLKNKGIPFYFLSTEGPCHFPIPSPKWANDIKFLDIDSAKIQSESSLALDKSHPNVDYHKRIAKEIYEKIEIL